MQENFRREGVARAMFIKVNHEAYGQIGNVHVMMQAYPFVFDVPQVTIARVTLFLG